MTVAAVLTLFGVGLPGFVLNKALTPKGHARPIRAEHLKLPADVQAKLLPNEQYGAAQPIKNAEAWEATSKKLPQMWQEQVIIEME